MISFVNYLELKRPVEQISPLQTPVMAVSGAVWVVYGFMLTPMEVPMMVVNAMLLGTSGFLCLRKFVYDPFSSAPSRSKLVAKPESGI